MINNIKPLLMTKFESPQLTMRCMEYCIPGEESNLKQECLTQKLNFQNTVFVQRGSYLPIPIEYTIQTEILFPFLFTYFKRWQIFKNRHFSHKPFFLNT